MLFVYITLWLLISNYSATAYIMTCYAKTGNPKPEKIDANLCTHLIIINDCTINEAGIHFPAEDMMHRYNKLKRKNPALKILISLTPSNVYMSEIAADQTKINGLSAVVRDYLIANNLDGFDIDWEFPVWSPGARATDRQGLSDILKKLREDFDSSGHRLLLTVAVCAMYNIVEKAYDANALNKYTDMIQIMNYDFHLYSRWHPFTGFNSPLHASPYEILLLGRINSEYATRYWLSLGITPSKLVFGIPVYGVGFELLSKHMHFPYAPVTGYAHNGGVIPYRRACGYLNSTNYRYYWDKYAASPYLVEGTSWLGIEDTRSVSEKAKFAKSMGIGGVMVFALDSDDHAGRCGQGKFPLTKVIRYVMKNPTSNSEVSINESYRE
ncbi:hypothetical protein M3Y94_00436400 [Aphelenchoides besseyi]|nr:hypothetical protein M3Y94_00436400 [Aphelenchoides besseyi]KAI6229440.1 hypothetical protein M3Y95_00531200 [Aphelenchoides besseyi]